MNIVLHQKTSKWTNMNKKLFKYKIVRFNLFMNIQTMVKVILILKNAKILIITKIQKEKIYYYQPIYPLPSNKYFKKIKLKKI